MKILLRTTNLVFLSWAQAMLRAEEIEPVVLDGHASVLQGSTYAIPRRLMVHDDNYERAHRLLTDAGEGHRLA